MRRRERPTTSGHIAITAKWNFQSGDISQNLIGKYAVKVSSPAGHFTLPITNFFTVSNESYKQSFTGNNSNLRFSRSFPDEAIPPFTAEVTNVAILVGILLRIFSISTKISVQ